MNLHIALRWLVLPVLALGLVACVTPPPPSTSMIAAVTDTPQPTLPPAPGAASMDGLRDLLSYVSPEWLNVHSAESPLSPELYLLDIAQARTDLNLPPVTGEDDRKAKLPLISKLGGNFDFSRSDHFARRGWDIADVQQLLWFGDDGTQIYRGNFSRPAVKALLLKDGYLESQLGGFAIFTRDDPKVDQYALKPDTIIISRDEAVLKSLIRRRQEKREGLDQHPVVMQMLQHLEGTWEALLAAAGSAEVAQRIFENAIIVAPGFEKALKGIWPEKLTSDFEFGWDALAIGWKGSTPEIALTFMYHYPSAAEAEKDIPLLEKTLTDNPSYSPGNRLWADILALQTLETEKELLIAQATARQNRLFLTSIANRDYSFLPVRTAPRVMHPTLTAISPGKAITSPYGANWTLYTNEREGFAVALPPKWTPINLDPDVLEDELQNLPQEFGDLARGAAATGVKFMGFDVSPVGRKASFPVNVNVLKADLPPGSSLDWIVSQMLQQLDEVTTTVKPIQHQRVQLGNGEAERLQFAQKLTLPSDQELSLNRILYCLVQGDSLFILSLAAPTEYAKNYAGSFEKIADSFQFVK